MVDQETSVSGIVPEKLAPETVTATEATPLASATRSEIERVAEVPMSPGVTRMLDPAGAVVSIQLTVAIVDHVFPARSAKVKVNEPFPVKR